MNSTKKHSDSKSKKLSVPKPKEEIEIIDDGPLYICDFCHALLKVPDERLEEAEIEEEDEENEEESILLLEVSFVCPKCKERNIVSEEELEEEPEEPQKKKK